MNWSYTGALWCPGNNGCLAVILIGLQLWDCIVIGENIVSQLSSTCRRLLGQYEDVCMPTLWRIHMVNLIGNVNSAEISVSIGDRVLV